MNSFRIPFWLKGGIVGVSILAIPVLYTILFNVEDGSFVDWIMLFMLYPYAFAAFWFGGATTLILGISQQALLYFALGVLIATAHRTITKQRMRKE